MRQLKNVQRRGLVMKAALISLLTLLCTQGFTLPVFAAGATLYLSPASKTVVNGTTFAVSVRISTSETINAVQADLSYPADKIDFISIDPSGTAFDVGAPSSGGGGNVSIARGSTTGVSGDQLVAIVNFKAKVSSGTANVNFASGSAAVRLSDNANVYSGSSGGTYTFAAPSTTTTPAPASSPTPKTPTTNTKPAAQASPSAGDTTAPKFTVAPTVTNLSLRTATVIWQTDEPSTSLVDYGLTTQYGLTAQTPGMAQDHSVVLDTTGLNAGTTYHFRVTSKDAAGNILNSSDATFSMKGHTAIIKITDTKNKPAKSATVKIGDKSKKTGADGTVVIDNLPGGKQVVSITFGGRTQKSSIEIDDSKTEPQNFTLTVRPLVTPTGVITLGLIVVAAGAVAAWLWSRKSRIKPGLSSSPNVYVGGSSNNLTPSDVTPTLSSPHAKPPTGSSDTTIHPTQSS
ncbi:MAG TPA: hypothetical protein VM124_00850 [Candidatus Limnocylindrales bacterium]|nr:hypothetical protein [Candidatus Limnocylindrales bacterium]